MPFEANIGSRLVGLEEAVELEGVERVDGLQSDDITVGGFGARYGE